jgi:hypothetical protein
VHVFLTDREATLYLDTSGEPLYKRGFKVASVEAPLKENLAAGIIMLSGWKPGVALLDPMCGSGTFLIEAAQMALRVAPGARRDFAFQRLRHFDPAAWKRLLDAARAGEAAAAEAGIFGSDISPVAVRATLANLDRAGLLPAVRLSTGDLLDIDAPAERGILVSNPPYGERVSDHDELAEFYPLLGSALKRRFAGWNCYLISADTRLPKLVRLTPSRKTPCSTARWSAVFTSSGWWPAATAHRRCHDECPLDGWGVRRALAGAAGTGDCLVAAPLPSEQARAPRRPCQAEGRRQKAEGRRQDRAPGARWGSTCRACLFSIQTIQNRQCPTHIAGQCKCAEMIFGVPSCQCMSAQLFHQFVCAEAATACQRLEPRRSIVGQPDR